MTYKILSKFTPIALIDDGRIQKTVAKHNLARPDLTLLYEIDEREALGRATRDGHADRIEAEGAAYQRRVQSAYARLRDHEPERLRGVDATGTIEDVFARTQKALSDFLDTKE